MGRPTPVRAYSFQTERTKAKIKTVSSGIRKLHAIGLPLHHFAIIIIKIVIFDTVVRQK